ncbi:MAG: type I-E CRISPR-associated protein Cas6/Cse3/CasE [Bacillota bacterium]
MDPLYMLELRFDLIALHRFLHAQGLCGGEDGDIGYGIHAWLGAAFGELAPKPWRLLMNGKRPPRILGYGPHDASVLTQRIVEFAEPTVLQVCPEPAEMIASRPMPTWDRGRRLGFQVLVCPVGRKSSTGTEKDLFLIRADTCSGNDGLSRETVYCEWAVRQFNDYSVTVDSIRLSGFRLAKQVRQTQSRDGKRTTSTLVRPQALLEGYLTVQEPDEFTSLLKRGIGRHRAFGYGMILLRPAS